MTDFNPDLVAVRGGGDVATGVIQKFHRSGFRVVVLEIPRPTAIRTSVALSCALNREPEGALAEAVISGGFTVEDMTAVAGSAPEDCPVIWAAGKIPVLPDPEADSLALLRPLALIDATLFKRNRELPRPTERGMAKITVGLGPGFSAPRDVDAVIETQRGHFLGRLILAGSALPNTGIPGELGGKSAERVVHSPVSGVIRHAASKIGDRVLKGETIFFVDEIPVPSPLEGTLRGLIPQGLRVPTGLKCADVDPRPAAEVDCLTISDKARCLGGAALEAVFFLAGKKGLKIR